LIATQSEQPIILEEMRYILYISYSLKLLRFLSRVILPEIEHS